MRVTQVLKLAVIANACFWLAVFFQYWKNARLIPVVLLQTILILGVIAIVINMGVYVVFLKKKWRANKLKGNNDGEPPVRPGIWILHFFNGVSFFAQIVFLISRL